MSPGCEKVSLRVYVILDMECCLQPLEERLASHIIDIFGYHKLGKGGHLKTGSSLKVNEVSDLAIIDIDIKKTLPDSQRAEIYETILTKLRRSGCRIVRSAHGGLHIYCNTGDFKPWSNAAIKCCQTEEFEVDVFCCAKPNRQTLVVQPGSQIRDEWNTPILTYAIVEDPPDGIIGVTIHQILELLGIAISHPPSKRKKIRPSLFSIASS